MILEPSPSAFPTSLLANGVDHVATFVVDKLERKSLDHYVKVAWHASAVANGGRR
jgi:hypothetical protein